MMRTVRRAPARRKMIWARTNQASGQGLDTTVNAFDLLTGFRSQNGGAMPLGTTVTRVRIDLAVFPVVGVSGILYGGLIVETAPLATGSFPDPFLQPHEDWMWWRGMPAVPPATSADQGDTIAAAYEIDVRSQRKMEELGQTLALVFRAENQDIPFSFTTSVLLKLP